MNLLEMGNSYAPLRIPLTVPDAFLKESGVSCDISLYAVQTDSSHLSQKPEKYVEYMRVRLNFPQEGTNDAIEVADQLTVSQLRSQMAARLEVKPQNVILSFQGNPLPDGGTLQAAGVQENARISVQTSGVEDNEETPDSAASTRPPNPQTAASQVAPPPTRKLPSSTAAPRTAPKPPAAVISPTRDLPKPGSAVPKPPSKTALQVCVTTPNGAVQSIVLNEGETPALLLARLGFANNDQQVFNLNDPEGREIGLQVALQLLGLNQMAMLLITANPPGGYFH